MISMHGCDFVAAKRHKTQGGPMKENQKYEQQLLLRTRVPPGHPTTVSPGSPNATQTTLLEVVWKQVACADTSKP